ncbi:MAG: hypothetical protein ACFFDF_12440 [Candidatus Odinarchaeota archaeon]
MISLEIPVEVKIAKEFLTVHEFFNSIGFEIIGTKNIDNETIYLVWKKRSYGIL